MRKVYLKSQKNYSKNIKIVEILRRFLYLIIFTKLEKLIWNWFVSGNQFQSHSYETTSQMLLGYYYFSEISK